MGLEFTFDETTLDQQVSREQLEIDLYDELVTITDAEPGEQVRLLAVRPPVGSSEADDKPESIRVTGSLGKEQLAASAPLNQTAAPVTQAVVAQTEMPITAPAPNGSQSQSLPGASPATPAAQPDVSATPRACGPQHGPAQEAIPSPRSTEVPPPPRPASAAPPVPVPSTAPPVVETEASSTTCSDCGAPAGDLDMICIECGAFIG